MNWPILALLFLGLAPAGAAESPLPRFPEISTYLADTSRWEVRAMDNGCIYYVIPAKLAKVLETRTVYELLEAIIADVEDGQRARMLRMADLTTIVLSGVKPSENGWISDQDRASGALVYRIPLPVIRGLERGFPADAAGWREYLKTVGRRPGG